ncbi:hypothetical protein [Hyalangium rubrum]|uniref:Uncharacterized protein n=1 Tax=Hyalangium rubrum TaxID=3103134 RepID=A0ABU5HGD2_9BACT|nr:hypothetical protein [Hyalangium sp. s54d21]MDY7232520.1 hypothetical protein [Hyalangium sp. s54d21]
MKKPEPDRTRPIRNWCGLFEPPAPVPPGDAASRGAAMGYRVIEEYLRQGQNVARGMGIPSMGTPPADEGSQRFGAMFRSFADFASLWMDWMGRAGAPFAPGVAPASGTAGPFAAGGGQTATETAKAVAPEPPVSSEPSGGVPVGLTLDIQSSRRVEVSVDLRPRSLGLPLVVHDLRAPEPDTPRITGVRLEALPEEERVCLRLQVPGEHPPGVYSGLILDERTSLPRGTLTVRIPPP